jgi:signal transduction histidine kinase
VKTSLASVPRYVAVTLVINTLIAIALTAFGSERLVVNLVFSHCIGLLTYAMIDLPRRALWPNGAPSVAGMAGLVLGASLAGWTLGHLLAGALLGDTLRASTHGSQGTAGFLVLTVAAGIAGTWLFWSRERAADLARAASVAQLRQLQAQIEPHFLFNTLANLDALIASDPKRARLMLGHLNDYLRVTLTAARRDRHTLADEFALLRGYLEIIAIRMGPRLTYELELPAALEDVALPPMLLQPLVENAIRHGLEPKLEGGRVRVQASEASGRLLLCVEDDGLGLPAAETHATAGTGLGVRHVRERLAALYGREGGLEVDALPAGGVRVTLRLPREPQA